MKKTVFLSCASAALLSGAQLATAQTARPAIAPAKATLTVRANQPGKAISDDLFGIFFEDINYAADGGLYAELVQNRSFEYTPQDNRAWNALTSWELRKRGGQGELTVGSEAPLNVNNPHYAVLKVQDNGADVALLNGGFDGIPLKKGASYNFSFWARQIQGKTPLRVSLERPDTTILSEVTLPELTPTWKKYTATLVSPLDEPGARLVIGTGAAGTIALDMVSLFPAQTFHNRPNGLRPDLAQTIADLHPQFVRFPGGCLAHGDGLENIYHWKGTVGPIETRRAQPNIWRYHQTTGLGYFEYFQFCEDIGAKPLPVVAAGVSCQNSHGHPGTGQECIPMAQMGQYIQDILDLVEYANGPATSKWGKVRAAAGHPAPFNLQYLGVGNEDAQTPEFRERFQMIYDAVRAKYPKLMVIGTVGPFHSGFDYDEGWKFARQLDLPMVDEHYYEAPEWFLRNISRYDTYNRKEGKVYLGEYASRGNSLFNALSEAAYMTGLEQNGDVVHLASYAPLLGKMGHTQWNPNLIYFDNQKIVPTVNYYVQQVFGANSGQSYVPSTLAYNAPVAPRQPIPAGVFVGTWNTQAQFDDVKVERNGTVLTGATFEAATPQWGAQSGQWGVAEGALTQTGNEQPALSRIVLPTGTATGEGYTYTLRARKTGGAEGFLIGFGAKDTDNYYWWNLGGWGNTQHSLEKATRGGRGALGDRVAGRIETGRWYNIKVVVTGQRIRCYLDDVLMHDVVDDNSAIERFVASTVRDRQTGDLIVKLVNVTPHAVTSAINLDGVKANSSATQTVLVGTPDATNTFGRSPSALPVVTSVQVGPKVNYVAPPYSLTVWRVKTR